MVTLADLQIQMAEAVKVFTDSGNQDMSKIQEVNKAMDKAKAEIAKANAVKLQAEAEQLAGKRESLSAKIHTANRNGQPFPNLDNELKAVKAWGFTYKVDKANPAEPDIVYKTVSLSTQTVKAHKAVGGGGASGKLKAITGLTRWEIMAQYGTAEEQKKLTDAGDGSRERWFASEPAIKRILNEHPELIKK